LSQDPGVVFGGLLSGCIRDDYAADRRRLARDGLIVMVLGVGSSFLTTYLLSFA